MPGVSAWHAAGLKGWLALALPFPFPVHSHALLDAQAAEGPGTPGPAWAGGLASPQRSGQQEEETLLGFRGGILLSKGNTAGQKALW